MAGGDGAHRAESGRAADVMAAYLHLAWSIAQSALVVLMIFYLLRVHRQLGRLREARSEAQRWLTEFVQTTNRLRESFGEIKERTGRLEADLAAAESRLGQIVRAEERRAADKAWAAAVRSDSAQTDKPSARAAEPACGPAPESRPAERAGQDWKAQLARLK